jgi:SAM-dependent methyltransferase
MACSYPQVPASWPFSFNSVRTSRSSDDAAAPAASVPIAYFEELYAGGHDPFRYRSRWYERRKYALTTACLPQERYHRCFEPASSIGELTRLLASRSDEVLACDGCVTAVARAKSSLSHLPNVVVEHAVVPANLPGISFDLIVFSEFLYYLSAGDLDELMDWVAVRLTPGGDLVAVHRWHREHAQYDGFNVHHTLRSRLPFTVVAHHEDDRFVLDVLRRSGP